MYDMYDIMIIYLAMFINIWFNAKNKHFRIKAECQKYEKFYFKLLARKQRYFRNLKFSRYFRKRDGSCLILDIKVLPLGIFILFYRFYLLIKTPIDLVNFAEFYLIQVFFVSRR